MKKQFLLSYNSPKNPTAREYKLIEAETEKAAISKLGKFIKKKYNPEDYPFYEDDINGIIESIENHTL